MTRTPEDIILAKIQPTGFCWLWTGKPNQGGYGVQHFQGKLWKAHRFVYTFLVGPIQDGLVLDHLCKVRICVNPDHLEPVTLPENVRRSKNMGKADTWVKRRDSPLLLSNRSHCSYGHDLAEVGVSVYRQRNKRTDRVCKQCEKIRRCKYKHKLGCAPTCEIQNYPLDTVALIT